MSTSDLYDDLESLFARHFVNGSTLCAIDCACGRTHFVGRQYKTGDYGDGELEEYERKAAESPDVYVEATGFDHIGYTVIAGRQIVMQCQCGEARRLAAFIVNNADRIATMLVDLFDREATDAAERLQKIRKLSRELAERVKEDNG